MPCVRAPIPCPLVSYQIPILGLPLTAAFELLGAALLFYQLLQQYELWERDLDNLQELAECYEEIGTCYKEARLALRGRDQEVYDYQNSRPSYPGPCEQRIQQARLNGLLSVSEEHGKALRTLPSWACGDKTSLDYDAAKASVRVAMHSMANSRNYEQNQEDRYEQMRITALARSAGGAIPNLSGAFRTVAAIAEDSLERRTSSLNSALGAFGNAAGSIANKYLTGVTGRITEGVSSLFSGGETTVINNNSSVVNNDNRTLEQIVTGSNQNQNQTPFAVTGSGITALNDPFN